MGSGPVYCLEVPIPIPDEKEFEEGYGSREALSILNRFCDAYDGSTVDSGKIECLENAELIWDEENFSFQDAWDDGEEVKLKWKGFCFTVRYVDFQCEYLGNTGDSALLIRHEVYFGEPFTDSYATIGKLISLGQSLRGLFPDLPEIKGYAGAHHI